MATIETAVPPWQLRLARHLVGLAAGTLAASLFMRAGLSWDPTDWVVSFVVTCGIAGAITGLVALFFTKSQAQHSLKNFIIAAWVVLGLMVFGHLQGVKLAKPGADTPTAAALPVQAGRALTYEEAQKPAEPNRPMGEIDRFLGEPSKPNSEPGPWTGYRQPIQAAPQSTMTQVDANRIEITEPDGRMTCVDLTKAQTLLPDGTLRPALPGAERPGPCR